MKYCPYCGADLLDGAFFCPECGKGIPDRSERKTSSEKKNSQDRKSGAPPPVDVSLPLPTCNDDGYFYETN